jgi:cathepsin X
MLTPIALIASAAVARSGRLNEVWTQEQTEAAGFVWRGSKTVTPLPQDYVKDSDLPEEHNWCNLNGTSYCTMSRNQHIPQYCGSCWAHGSVSALGDRVKIARKQAGDNGIDINLSVQHILNCANAGSCHGGSVDGPYQWLHEISQKTGTGISYETSNPYMACSSESEEGLCPSGKWDCTAANIAKTCSTFPPQGKCTGLSHYPNVTISEFGSISGANAMQKEIFARGPISCGIDASPILEYTGGIFKGSGMGTDHVISVVGWGQGPPSGIFHKPEKYWIVRNSWGEYWGEMGYIRVAFGSLSLESGCAWAVPDTITTKNFPCDEGGDNCAPAL